MNKKIYVADDEKNIRDIIQIFLEKEHFIVEVFEDGEQVLERFQEEEPDLVILDIMMPKKDGLSTLIEIRKTSDVPVILLTARDSDADYVAGFNIGCDDYIIKPFSPVKFTTKVKAILGANRRVIDSDEEIKFSDLIFLPLKRAAYCNDMEIRFTATEYALILYLIKNNDRAISRDELLEKVWGYENFVETRATDDTVKRIRKKLMNSDSKVIVETVWGFGFKIGEVN